MDKDEYFQILEEACCYNIENYVTDPEWAGISGLSHIVKSKEDNDNKDYFQSIEDAKSQKEKNAFKILE